MNNIMVLIINSKQRKTRKKTMYDVMFIIGLIVLIVPTALVIKMKRDKKKNQSEKTEEDE
mgnify:CR=1 FL=1